MTDIERELLALKRADPRTAKYVIEAELKDLVALIADREKAAFERGRVAEAKICEEAQRHA